MTEQICFECKEKILNEFIDSEGKAFHPEHFNCKFCEKTLINKKYYIVDGLFYCSYDYFILFGSICEFCHSIIKFILYRGDKFSIGNANYHADHLFCVKCFSKISLIV